MLVALEEGTVDLDEPAGPEGSTLRHLLAHASGLPPDDGPPLMPPARRRIYSNTGIELAADLVAGARRDSVRRVLPRVRRRAARPRRRAARLAGAGRTAARSTTCSRSARELLAPTLVAPETLDEATSVQFPGLSGVLPGFGRMDPNDWGLAFELRDAQVAALDERAQLAADVRSLRRAAGTFLWVDPELGCACGVLTDKEFGAWALEAWPRFNDCSRPRTAVVGSRRTSRGRSSRRRPA